MCIRNEFSRSNQFLKMLSAISELLDGSVSTRTKVRTNVTPMNDHYMDTFEKDSKNEGKILKFFSLQFKGKN